MIFITASRRSRQLTALASAAVAVAAVTACSSPGGAAAGEPSPAAAAQSARAAAAVAAARSRSVPAQPSSPASPGLAAGARRVTFVNKVRQTIWVAAAQNPAHPLATTGWVLPPGHRVTIIVPNRWNGRFWGRTGCVFRRGVGHCQTGDCAGRFRCAGDGAVPATLAEYDLDAWNGLDFYDVSMVDGSNLPMYINVTSGKAGRRVSPNGCVPAGCTKLVVCPKVLRVRASGAVVACESACARFGTDQYCCRGPWAARAQCNPAKWPVDYAAVFKRAEPYAYSYVDDDATSVYTCQGQCDYQIVFGITPRR
jgi:Thaumatin family